MNQECVKPDAGDSERECSCKIGNQRQATAQKVLERYAWPGELRWLGHRPWDTTDPQDYRCFVDICYLGGGEMSCDSGRVKLYFHVKFADDGAVSEAYAHDMRGCVVGQRGDVLHRESNPKAPSVIAVIRDANSPKNGGEGYLVCVTTADNEFFRGAVQSSENEIEESGTLSLVLWEPRRNGNGPTGSEHRVSVSSIAAIEVEW